jgi:drug/metabolite transporter (DMT)-like permease
MILLTVILVSVGQVMFKYVSLLITANNPVLGFKVLSYIVLAFFISGCGTLIYIALLRSMTLSKAYPFMAMSFVIVPVLSCFFYGDKLSISYFAGIALIVIGIAVVTGNT